MAVQARIEWKYIDTESKTKWLIYDSESEVTHFLSMLQSRTHVLLHIVLAKVELYCKCNPWCLFCLAPVCKLRRTPAKRSGFAHPLASWVLTPSDVLGCNMVCWTIIMLNCWLSAICATMYNCPIQCCRCDYCLYYCGGRVCILFLVMICLYICSYPVTVDALTWNNIIPTVTMLMIILEYEWLDWRRMKNFNQRCNRTEIICCCFYKWGPEWWSCANVCMIHWGIPVSMWYRYLIWLDCQKMHWCRRLTLGSSAAALESFM